MTFQIAPEKQASLTASVLYNLHLSVPAPLAFLLQRPTVRSGRVNPPPINDPIHSGWCGSEASVVGKRFPGQRLQPRLGFSLKHSKPHKPLHISLPVSQALTSISPAPSILSCGCVSTPPHPQHSGLRDKAISPPIFGSCGF